MKAKLLVVAAAFAALAACAPTAKKEEPPPPPPPPVAAAVDVPAGLYVLENTHASLTWRVMHMGLSNYTARFAKFDATIEFDPANPTASKVTATIDPTSVRTDYPGNYKATHKGSPFKTWDEDLAKNDKWFNAGKFPAITFTSTGVELTGATTGKVTGDLEMLGVKKPVTLDVTFNGSKNPHPFIPTAALGFSASGTIKRSEFGMTNLIGGIGDDVQIFIEAEFIQAPPGGAAAKK